MLYAWLYYGDRFKDFYLPDAERWSERLPLWQSESDWDQDYFISVYSIDNVRYISPPALFRWDHAEVLRGDLSFELGKRYTMRNGDYSLGIIFPNVPKRMGLSGNICSLPDARFPLAETRDARLSFGRIFAPCRENSVCFRGTPMGFAALQI